MRLWPLPAPLHFILGFGLWIALFSLTLQIPAVDEWAVLPMTAGIAQVSNAGLHLLGYETIVQGTIIQEQGGFSVNILKGCNGVYVMAIFASAVLAFPVPWKLKLLGLGAGLPAVQIINLGRIISLYYVGAEHPDLFETFHMNVWQTIVILLSMMLWLGWTELANRVARP